MAEFEYHPDICSACLKSIGPSEPVVIIDDTKEPPRYYHERCLFDFFDIIAVIHGYLDRPKGANYDHF